MHVIREDEVKGWRLVEIEDGEWYVVYRPHDIMMFAPFAMFEKTPRGWRAGQTLIRSLL